MNGAQLVAVRVSHVGEVHRPERALTQARWLLDRRTAVGHRRVVEGLQLLRRAALERDRAAVGRGGWLAVDGLGDAEAAAVVPVEQAGLPGGVHVAHGLAGTEHAEHGVVEALRALDVIGADHDVIEQACLLVVRVGWEAHIVGTPQ